MSEYSADEEVELVAGIDKLSDVKAVFEHAGSPLQDSHLTVLLTKKLHVAQGLAERSFKMLFGAYHSLLEHLNFFLSQSAV